MLTPAQQLTAVLDHWQSGRGPLYQQLADAIVALAESGSLEHGAKLPSERALATELHLSRNTVTAAYQQLREAGWLEVKPGAAPRLGSLSRGVMALSAQDRFSKLLTDRYEPLIPFSTASPPPAPIVTRALADLGDFIGGSPAVGNGYAALGDRELVLAVTDHLRAQGVPARPDEVVITSGAQQAIWLIVTTLGGPAKPVALESITYPGVFDAVQAAGSRPLALPMRDDGLDARAAAKLLRASRPDLAYLTTFHNPTGTAMTEESALEVLRAAQAVDTTVIDDRTIGDLALDGRPRRPLASYGSGASVITVGGMSKVFWGGLRIGWLHTNATLAAQLRHRRAAMDLGSPAVFQRISARMLREHYQETLAWRIESLRESLDATRGAVREHGLDWTWHEPEGGPSLWVQLGDGSADRFAERSTAAGAPVAPGSSFEVIPGAAVGHFRLPFYLPPEQMRLGVKMLAERAA
ncbi:PLP-dependent aminotransferase family protein [Demequina zhanjiangensis]|uniref:PLP-dependent aminotransferase family protein n=1 Tax=Demequina zhanjiangensis TaxID=3051659 RepID=A0ABT8FXV1_9MICO|nr:PLP-dependent aminotransferase family protein [Demequina sp. SYSU T00b26]MDN4471633.1 PLP-dependent aminotransferase family protein [Demequina sp. SYSU T00b26]